MPAKTLIVLITSPFTGAEMIWGYLLIESGQLYISEPQLPPRSDSPLDNEDAAVQKDIMDAVAALHGLSVAGSSETELKRKISVDSLRKARAGKKPRCG